MQVSPIEGGSRPTGNSRADGAEVLIDFDKLQHRIGRNTDFLRDLISLFLSSQPKDIRGLRQAVDAGDLVRSRRIAHRIAGSFASLAMDVLARGALEIEQQAAAGRLDACKVSMADLETRFEIAKRQLSGALSGMTGR